MLDAKQITRLHDDANLRWHQATSTPQSPSPAGPVGPRPVQDAPPSATPELSQGAAGSIKGSVTACALVFGAVAAVLAF